MRKRIFALLCALSICVSLIPAAFALEGEAQRAADTLATLGLLGEAETGYDIYEVKNSPEVSEQFIRDAGFQNYIISRCGLKIGRIYIVIHGPNEEKPFVPCEVTKEAKGYWRWINDHIWDLNRMQKERDEVLAEPGDQCCDPYACWYYGYCHGETSPQG